MLCSSEGLLADDWSGRLVVDVEISGRAFQHFRRKIRKFPEIFSNEQFRPGKLYVYYHN